MCLGLAACDRDACLEPRLDRWCWHQEEEGRPPGAEPCAAPTFDPGPNAFRCGDFDVQLGDPGLSVINFYFDATTQDLVAVQYWTDLNVYCGESEAWYGQRVDCDVVCTYDPDPIGAGLPVCEGS